MGAQEFTQRGRGKTAREAFAAARQEALHENGHGGYSGSLAEKHEFVLLTPPAGVDPRTFASDLMENDDPRISDKWGPAGCVKIGPEEFVFFGWASS